jgi:outer membrane cobalamin receptor
MTIRSKYFLFCCAFLIVATAVAQNNPGGIVGSVSDSTGAVIPAAFIEAKNVKTGELYKTDTGEAGQFKLADLPVGKYDLKVMLQGFKTHIQKGISVLPESSAIISIVLEVEPISETITIQSSSPLRLLDHPLEEPAALKISISSIDSLQIEKQGAKTVLDALEYMPGAWVESRGRKVKQFVSFRGQKYPYPEYSVDGAVFREFHEVPYFFSVGDVERIEVLRSSASLLKGFSGLAGVIDIVPRTYEKRQTSWLAEYGSRNSYRIHVSHGQKIGGISYGLGLDSSRSGGPDERRGDERMLNLFGDVSWQVTPSLFVRTNIFHLQGRRELVQAVPPAGKRFQTARETFDPIQTSVWTLKTLYQPKDWTTTQFTVGYSNRHNIFVSESDTSAQSTPDYDWEWNLNLLQSLELSESNVFRIGANYNHWVAPYGKRFYAGKRSDLETASFAVADEHSFGRLVLDGGMRYQRTYINEYGAFNINGSQSGLSNVTPIIDMWDEPQVSGSVGVTYLLTGRVALRGNFLAGAIEPRNGTLTIDLKEPETEHRTMVDAGFQFKGDRVGDFSLVGFYIRQADAIVLSGQTLTVEASGRIMELYLNRDQDTKGLEFDFHSKPLFDKVNLLFNITAMNPRARMDGSMQRDPEKPRVIISTGVLGKQWDLDYNFFWKYVSGYESSRFASPAVPQPLGDFNTFNLTVGHPLGHYENTRVYLEITNLTDNLYSTVVGYPDYGRSFRLGIRHGF